jgi:hypothetical protein
VLSREAFDAMMDWMLKLQRDTVPVETTTTTHAIPTEPVGMCNEDVWCKKTAMRGWWNSKGGGGKTVLSYPSAGPNPVATSSSRTQEQNEKGKSRKERKRERKAERKGEVRKQLDDELDEHLKDRKTTGSEAMEVDGETFVDIGKDETGDGDNEAEHIAVEN